MYNRLISSFSLCALVFVLGLPNTYAQQQIQPQPWMFGGSGVPTLADVVSQVESGIVNIAIPAPQRHQFVGGSESFQKFFDNFFSADEERATPFRNVNQGSGVIYDATGGYILTNDHLLPGVETASVTLWDGRTFEATKVGSDSAMDLALLKIKANGLENVKFGNSSELRVGDFVLAFGNNYGMSSSVTSGIVSALGRSGLGMDQYQDFIQTDAAINPGSSGGALVNLKGEVVGINTAILAPTGGNVGIGFAIPINAAISIADQIREHGSVERGLLGVHFEEIDGTVAAALGIDPRLGVRIKAVMDDSAAAEVGLKEMDIVTHVNDEEILGGASLRSKIALIRPGESVTIKFSREGVEDLLTGTGTIRGATEQIASIEAVQGELLMRELAGAEFKSDVVVSSQGPRHMIVVSSVDKGSEAWDAGIREGDIIVRVNRGSFDDIESFSTLVQERTGALMLEIIRNNSYRYIVIG